MTTTRWRPLSISVVLPGTVMARSYHGDLLTLKHRPPPPKPHKPPTTHARKVPPTPRFVESSETHDVWDHRNLLLLACGYVLLSLCRGRAAIASRASATKLVKHGLREVSFPFRPSEVFGLYPRPRSRGLWIQAPFLSKVNSLGDRLGEPPKEYVVSQPSSQIQDSKESGLPTDY